MQELPCLGGAGQGSSMSTTSDESEAMHTHMPSPGRKQTHTARDDRPSLLKSAVPAKPSSKAQSTLPAAVSLDTGISRSHRTRERDRARERHHDRTKSVVRIPPEFQLLDFTPGGGACLRSTACASL